MKRVKRGWHGTAAAGAIILRYFRARPGPVRSKASLPQDVLQRSDCDGRMHRNGDAFISPGHPDMRTGLPYDGEVEPLERFHDLKP